MKNKVLLIRPRNIYGLNNYPSLGLIHLTTELKMRGFNPHIIDCAMHRQPHVEIIKHLHDTLLIGVTMLTSECPDAYKILTALKEVSRIPVVVGGWHPTLFPSQMICSGLVSHVITGFGDQAIVSLAEGIQRGDSTIPAVISGSGEDIAYTGRPMYGLHPAIGSLIKRPLTDIGPSSVHGRNLRWLPYQSSTGCPSRCKFCCNVVADQNKWHARTAEQTVRDMTVMAIIWWLNHIKVVDDNFFVDIERICDIDRRLSQEYHKWTWDAECRADSLGRNRISLAKLLKLKTTGLIQLTIGIESGSQKSLDLMRKGITLEQAEEAVARCNEARIYARCSFIVEVPGESSEDIELTRKFVNKLRRKYKYFTCGVQTFRPYPKCELTEELVESGQLLSLIHI